MSKTQTDPSVLSDGQLLQFCAAVLEQHAESIFVYARDGRRLIAELRKRSGGTAPPETSDVVEDELNAVADTGEVVMRVPGTRPRSQAVADESYWLPNPGPERVNIRMTTVDEGGVLAEMELGNAPAQLAALASSILIQAHSELLKERQGKVA
jgi:hypothetical protein